MEIELRQFQGQKLSCFFGVCQKLQTRTRVSEADGSSTTAAADISRGADVMSSDLVPYVSRPADLH